jgi:hypothetical protein
MLNGQRTRGTPNGAASLAFYRLHRN